GGRGGGGGAARGGVEEPRPAPPPLPAGPRRDVLDLALGDGRQEYFVAEPAALDDHAVLELAAQPPAEGRDHARRPPRRENPVSASASASATCDDVGSASSLSRRRTECCT